jgi:hypothetical protein
VRAKSIAHEGVARLSPLRAQLSEGRINKIVAFYQKTTLDECLCRNPTSGRLLPLRPP